MDKLKKALHENWA